MTLVNDSRKMRFIAIAIAVVILAATLVYRYTAHTTTLSPAINNTTATSTLSTIDTDKDGVSDWEEALFGSDPNDPSSIPTMATSTNSLDASSTATSLLAHNLLQQFLINTKGGSMTLNDPTALGNALANSVAIPTPTYHVYALADISTVANTDTNRAQYQKNMQDTLAPMKQGGDAEIALYTEAIQGNAAAATQLQAMVDTYTKVADAAAKLSVPNEAVLVHLSAVNALGYYAAVLRELLKHTEDPVGSLVLLRAYNEAEQGVFDSFKALHTYFATHITTS